MQRRVANQAGAPRARTPQTAPSKRLQGKVRGQRRGLHRVHGRQAYRPLLIRDFGCAGLTGIGPDLVFPARPAAVRGCAIVTGQHNPNGVAVGASHLYWANNGDGTIWEANLDGSSPHAIATGQHDPLGVAVGPN